MKKRIVVNIICLSFMLSYSSSLFAIQPFTFILRRSIVDKNTIEKPAQLLITWPEEGENSYAFDLGLSTTILSLSSDANNQWEFGIFAEYHWNTIADKEQNSFLGGATLLGIVGDILQNKKWSLLPQAALKFKNDNIKDTKSFISSADSTLIYRPLNIGEICGPPALGFLWQPRMGFEFEKVFDAPEEKPKGQVFRFVSCLDIAFYPAQKLLKQKLELSIWLQHWSDFAESDSIDTGSDSHRLIKVTLRYYLSDNASIALERVDGENPTEGFPKQKYTQLAFQLKH